MLQTIADGKVPVTDPRNAPLLVQKGLYEMHKTEQGAIILGLTPWTWGKLGTPQETGAQARCSKLIKNLLNSVPGKVTF